jgi:hypothetical protein
VVPNFRSIVDAERLTNFEAGLVTRLKICKSLWINKTMKIRYYIAKLGLGSMMLCLTFSWRAVEDANWQALPCFEAFASLRPQAEAWLSTEDGPWQVF